MLYGGGEGISYTGTTNLTINGGSFADTYVTATGSNGYTGNANLTISGGDFGTVVQGVNRGEADAVTIKISGGNFNEVYAGGETADSSVSATYNTAKITVEGDAVIKKLLPGSNGNSTTDDATNVSLKVGKDATIKNITNKDEAFDLFGDSAEIEALKNVPFYYDGTTRKLGKETRPFFFANGTPITISEGENGTVITWADGSVEVASNTNVFGGYHDDDTAIETSVVMNGGTVNAIFGGGLHKSHVTKASVKINKGTINYQVCGGGASSFTRLCGCENGSTWYAGDPEESPCRVDNVELIVEDGAVFKGAGYSLLYGGGEGISYTGTTNLTVNGGSFADTYVTATGSNGYTGNANLTINSGDFGTVVQGVNRGEADKVTIKINGGTFNEVYAGGETADSSVSATYNSVKITVDGNAIIEKLLPGSNGNSTTDDATNVSLKVGKTATIKNITDEKTAKEIFNENTEYKKDTKPTAGGGSSVVKYEIKVVTPENGGIYPNGKVRVKKGNEQKFTFVPDDGYEISKILVDGEEVDVFDFYIFKNVRSDHTIEVIFEKNTSDWAEKEVENAKKNGLVPTVLENKDLTLEITRLEFASACVKLYEKLTNKVVAATKTDVFEDCNDTEVLKAFELGITNGVSETAFAPNSNITREQMATMLARTIALTGRDTTVYTKDIKFADESTVSTWAKNSVRYMAQEELINGVGEGKFAPTGTATREQTLAISERTFEKFSK